MIEKNKHPVEQKCSFTYLTVPFISGLLIITAFPPFEQAYMAWISLIPLLWTCLRVSPLRAFGAGFVFSLPFTTYVNLYLATVLYPYLSTLLATAAMIALVVYISIFYGLFALAASLSTRFGRTWFTALAVPSSWLIVEYLRSLGFMAYNVGYLGYTQWSSPWLLNIASVYGYWGLPFLIVFFQGLIVVGYLCYLKQPRPIELLAPAAVFVLLLVTGIFLPQLQTVSREETPLKVALIQGNIHPEQVIERDDNEIFRHYLDLTAKALESEPAIDLVVWPETVARLDFRHGTKHPEELARLADRYNADIMYGARIRDDRYLYNSIAFYSGNRYVVPVYHKHRLVPFVEFFPAEEMLNRILQIDLLLGSYTAGEEITVFNSSGIALAGVVCFESYFGDHMRLFTASGAKHLFVVTNDAWFNETIGLEQHAQAGAIRAAESGAGVTQVANSGITISFDYRGKELFRSGKNQEETIIMTPDLATRNTLYSQYGDYFPLFWSLFLAVSFPFLTFTLRKESFL